MAINTKKVGDHIASLRRAAGLTQNELGDRLNLSSQAVSGWERGLTLPDVTILPELAAILRTSVDNLLSGGERQINYRGKIKVDDMREGLLCLKRMGELLGRDNCIYRHAVDGINMGMNVSIEEAFSNERVFECFVAEAVIQNLMTGAYIDLTDVKNSFRHKHFCDIVLDHAGRYGIV